MEKGGRKFLEKRTNDMKLKNYSFVYIRQPWLTRFERSLLMVGFCEIPSQPDKKKIESALPFPFKKNVVWVKNIIIAETKEWYQTDIVAWYNDDVRKYLKEEEIPQEEWDEIVMEEFDDDPEDMDVEKYLKDIEKWIGNSNKLIPLKYVYSTECMETKELEQWNNHYAASLLNVPDQVAPDFIEALLSTTDIKNKETANMVSNIALGIAQTYLKIPSSSKKAILGLAHALKTSSVNKVWQKHNTEYVDELME